jgi:broad specificity phosphatase PhoE
MAANLKVKGKLLERVVGLGKLIDPSKLAQIFISPRKRAQTTFHLLFDGVGLDALNKGEKVTMEKLEEWDYGGLLTKEIRAIWKRERPGQGKPLHFHFQTLIKI